MQAEVAGRAGEMTPYGIRSVFLVTWSFEESFDNHIFIIWIDSLSWRLRNAHLMRLPHRLSSPDQKQQHLNMVSLKAVRAANGSRSSTSPTAVFAGSTSGIGLGTIEALLQHTTAPTITIIGRSRPKFSPTLSILQQLNPKATITFIEGQISSLKEVARICKLITTSHTSLDYLWLSQGGLANATGALSAEALNEDLAVNYYSRMLFMHRLLPLLNASSDPRIVSVLSAGQEGILHTSDLGLQDPKAGYGVFPTMKHNVTLMSLAMRELSVQNPTVSFIHCDPGMVSTAVHGRWIAGWTGPWAVVGWLMNWTLVPVSHWLGSTPEEAGQVGFYELTNLAFAAQSGTNFFRLSEKAEVLKVNARLKAYEDDGSGPKVCEHTLQVIEKVLSQ